MVGLVGLAFDHGRGSPLTYTLPLRNHRRRPITPPEWPAEEPSLAAYVIDRLPPAAVILARFINGGAGPEIEVRAAAVRLSGSGPGPSLPDVQPFRIAFSGTGDSGWCAVPFDTTPLRVGVGAAVVEWTWAYRSHPQAEWTPFARSVHRIYTVLSQPTRPWSTNAGEQHRSWPLVEALDVSCEWAKGAMDVAEAAGRITAAVNALGRGVLSYDAVVGAPHYTLLGIPHFLLDAFLDRLRGRPGAGPLCNCSDCATIVSTFSNLLGADLSQSMMGVIGVGFPLNPILAIGQQLFSRVWGSFAFHEVAWTGACTERDSVFDACLRTDADVDPSSAPHRPSLPINQRFGEVGSGGYRDQLATPEGRAFCSPQPQERRRRPFAEGFASFHALAVTDAARLEQRLSLTDLSQFGTRTGYFFDGFRWFGNELPGWRLLRSASLLGGGEMIRGSSTSALSRVLVSWWESERANAPLRIESYETPSSAATGHLLLNIAAGIECPFVDPLPAGWLGDIAFTVAHGALIIFTRGNHVHVLHRADASADVTGDAKRLDAWLTRAGRQVVSTAVAARTEIPRPVSGAAGWTRYVLQDARAARDARGLNIVARGESASVQMFVVTPADASPTASASAGSPSASA